MTTFIQFLWPRSLQSLSVWIPLIAVGVISCAGLSLAVGFAFGALAQQDRATLRDGPPALQPRTKPAEGPLRSSTVVATGYGPLVITVFWGEEGQRLDLPGLARVRASETTLASPAALAQSRDDWTGEMAGWLGDGPVQRLPDAALAHPRELAIVQFTDTVPPEVARNFHPIRGGRTWAPETSFVIMGLLILVLPSIALARAGAAVHLSARSRRYGLLRALGAPPRQLAAAISADMAVPMLAGALAGSVAYTIGMSLLKSFTLAGASYWASDLRVPATLGIGIPLVVALVGLASVVGMVRRASGDPLGTLRRERPRRIPYLSYILAAGAVAGPIAMFAASEADFTLSVWLIAGGLLLSVVGLEGLSRVAVAVAGRLLRDGTRAQVAGGRMSRSGAETLLGISATAVAVTLVVFLAYSNFENRPPPVGNYAALAELPNLESPGPIVRAMSDVDGVTRAVAVGRHPVFVGDHSASLYTMTCDEAKGMVELDAPCAAGRIYLPQRRAGVDAVRIGDANPDDPGFTDPSLPGVYPVGGQVTAAWIAVSSNKAILMVDERPTPNHALLLVATDGSPGSLRRVMETFRSRPEESYPTTRIALSAGLDEENRVFFPYLFVMAAMAMVMATVAMLYAIALLFRQREEEFKMLRCQGATRRLLAVDMSLLFGAPLILALGLAIASGIVLAASYNTSFGVPTPPGNPQAVSGVAFALAVGVAATALVAAKAIRIPPLASDPDATTA